MKTTISTIMILLWCLFIQAQNKPIRHHYKELDSIIKVLNLKNPFPKMIQVKGGEFEIKPSKELKTYNPKTFSKSKALVKVKDFKIAQTETTIGQYLLFCNITNYRIAHFDKLKNDNFNLPITQLRYNDVKAYCNWLSKILEVNISIPTEQQWKFAAHGGTNSKNYKYSGSNKIDSVAWYTKNSNEYHPVATKQPNELGLFDLSGNASEFTQTGIAGGSCYSKAKACRIGKNNKYRPWVRGGFRVVAY